MQGPTKCNSSLQEGWHLVICCQLQGYFPDFHTLQGSPSYNASHLVKHLDMHGLLYNLQHGIRAKWSCEKQLTMLVQDLAWNLSVGKQTDLVLLDFQRRLIVNHSKLLWKLHQDGVRDTISGLQMRVRIGKLFSLFLIQNICCGYSKEPSQ